MRFGVKLMAAKWRVGSSDRFGVSVGFSGTTGGGGMARIEDRDDALKALARMIVYARNEATRLQVSDAALLLEYAEDAVVLRDRSRDGGTPDEPPPSPVVHH